MLVCKSLTMKQIIKLCLTSMLLFLMACSSNNPIPIVTGNTQEFFKYTVNNQPERIFDSYASGHFVASPTNDPYKRFFFRASSQETQAGSLIVDGDFTFQDWSVFMSSTNYNWGVSDGVTANFYFTELTPGNMFFSHPIVLPNNPVNCVVTVHPLNVGDYIEFTFSGDYLDASDTSIQGTVSGEGRIKRKADQ